MTTPVDRLTNALCNVVFLALRVAEPFRKPQLPPEPHARITRQYEWTEWHICSECDVLTRARFIEWDDHVTTAECGVCGYEEVVTE